MPLEVEAEDGARLLRLDQRLVQAARGRVAQHLGEDVHGGEVGVRARRHVVDGLHELRVADAAERDRALAVLHGLDGVDLLDRARGARDGREVFVDERERLRLVELAGDGEHGVIRLVVVVVESLQPLDGHVLDV